MLLTTLEIEQKQASVPEPVEGRAGRVDRVLSAFRAEYEPYLTPPTALALVELLVENRDAGEAVQPLLEPKWRDALFHAMEEVSGAQLIDAFDMLRDVLHARLAFRYPPLLARCSRPRGYDGLYELHGRAHRLLRAGRTDDLVALAEPALSDQSLVYGLDHDHAVRAMRQGLASVVANAEVEYIPSAEAKLVPTYDALRFRLLSRTAVHALSARERNTVAPNTVWEWGAIYGYVDCGWQIVGFD